MSVSIKFDPLERNVVQWLKKEMSPEAHSRALASFARKQLAEAQEVNRRALGRVPDHQTFVDGQKTERLDGVRPNGRIIFEFDLLVQSFAWIGELLEEKSPKKRGTFSRSWIFLADDSEADPAKPPVAAEYVYINTQAYARKLERGASRQAPAGVAQAVALMSARRFGNVARVTFGYRSLLGVSALSAWAGKTKSGRGSGARRTDWLQRQPAVIIRVF